MSGVTRGKRFPFINHNANLSGHERIHLLFVLLNAVLRSTLILTLVAQISIPHFYLIGFSSYTVVTTDIVYYKFLLRYIMKIQDQHLSRLITSNQVLPIPLDIIGLCIFSTQLKNLLSSNCILDPRWTISLP